MRPTKATTAGIRAMTSTIATPRITRSRLRRKYLAIAGAGALALTGVTVGLPSPASAASCYAASCYGQDPWATGCYLDAQTVASVPTSDGLVNLRWSNTCQANWAQVENVSTWGINFWVINKHNDKQSYGWGWFGAASGWSNMVNGHNILAQACDNNGCTIWK